jgi:uncharacterized protein (TIGR04255 family)
MKYPTHLKECTILESVFEIRFDSNVPEDAVFGMVYPELKKRFNEFKKDQVIDSIPPDLKNTNFKYHFTHFSDIENYSLRLGPHIFSLVKNPPYDSWSEFFKIIKWCLEIYFKLGLINRASRIGLRYIDFFNKDKDLCNKIKVKSFIEEGTDLSFDKRYFQTFVSPKTGDFECKLIIGEDVKVTDKKTGQSKKGSIVDVDIIAKNIDKDNVLSVIGEMKSETKRIFFELLKEDFIKELGPDYN